MVYQIVLSEEDYASLAAASTRSGEPIERLVHRAIAAQYAPPPVKQSGAYQHPTGEPLTEQEWREEEELAQSIGSERPWASEIVIEDRGPR
ncbi:MAG: hypothetical protein ACRDHP_11945 [Ktedonobacterales bacterium]